MRGRLVIFILTNGGRVTATLESEGFTIRDDPKSPKHFSFIASSDVELEENPGFRFNVELHNMFLHVNEMICEFGSVRSLVEVAIAMRRAAQLAARGSIMKEGSFPPPAEG
jgi:hypothetical protein